MSFYTSIRWTARISGLLILLFLSFFLLSSVFGHEKFGAFRNNLELLMFICFPISTILGLGCAFWRPVVGGLVVLVGLGVLFWIRPLLARNIYLLAPVIPAILFIVEGMVINSAESKVHR